MADSSLNTPRPLRRPFIYGGLMMGSVVLTSSLPVVGACLVLVFLCLMALETPARAVLGLGFVALGGLEVISLVSGDVMAPGLPVVAAGLVPAILLAPRTAPPQMVPALREPGALEAELALAAEKLELLRGSDLDGQQARCLEDAIASCETVRAIMDREMGLRSLEAWD